MAFIFVWGVLFITPARAELLHFGCGDPSGLFFRIGSDLSSRWNSKLSGIRVVPEVTGASVDNLNLLAQGKLQLAMAREDFVLDAYYGRGEFTSHEIDLRAVLPVFPSLLHFVARKKMDLFDPLRLDGKEVSLGPEKSGTRYMAERILSRVFQMQGPGFSDRRFSFPVAAKALKNNRIDFAAFCVAAPSSFIIDLVEVSRMSLAGFRPEDLEAISNYFPFYPAFSLPPGVYGNTETIDLPGVWNLLVCRTDMDEGVVFDLVETAMETMDRVSRSYGFSISNALKRLMLSGSIPVHPGAEKYFSKMQ